MDGWTDGCCFGVAQTGRAKHTLDPHPFVSQPHVPSHTNAAHHPHLHPLATLHNLLCNDNGLCASCGMEMFVKQQIGWRKNKKGGVDVDISSRLCQEGGREDGSGTEMQKDERRNRET